MSYYHFRATVRGLVAAEGAMQALASSTVNVYQPGTSTAVAFTLYSDSTLSPTLSNPITNPTNGIVDIYLAAPQSFDLYVTSSGFNPTRASISSDAQNSMFVPDGNDDFTNDTYPLPVLVSTSLPATSTSPYGN